MAAHLDDVPPALRALFEAARALVRRSATGRVLLGRAAGLVPEAPWEAALQQAREEASAPLEPRAVERALRAAWGRPPARVLDALELGTPVAVTPLAQVHRGELDGEPVAVKVARPGLAAAVRSDLALLEALRPALAAALPGHDAGVMVAEIRERVLDELDLEHEAAQQRAVARALRGRAPVEIPAGHSELAAPGVSVSGFLDGPTLAAARPADPGAVARALVAAYVAAARAGLVLCDPRPNHVVLRPDGSVGLLGTGAAVAVDRSRLRGWIALAGSLRAADPGAFAAEAAELALLERAADARAVHGLLREVFGNLVAGPARLDGAALAAVADRALPRAGAAVALAARARPEPHDVWLGRGGGQLLAVLAGLGAREDWLALLE